MCGLWSIDKEWWWKVWHFSVGEPWNMCTVSRCACWCDGSAWIMTNVKVIWRSKMIQRISMFKYFRKGFLHTTGCSVAIQAGLTIVILDGSTSQDATSQFMQAYRTWRFLIAPRRLQQRISGRTTTHDCGWLQLILQYRIQGRSFTQIVVGLELLEQSLSGDRISFSGSHFACCRHAKFLFVRQVSHICIWGRKCR